MSDSNSGLKRFGSRSRSQKLGDRGLSLNLPESPVPMSCFVEYKHETYQCEKCHGYGTVNRLDPEELGGDDCTECHGLGCVGDEGTVVRVAPVTVERQRRKRNKDLKKKIGEEAYKKQMREEWVARSKVLAGKRSPGGYRD